MNSRNPNTDPYCEANFSHTKKKTVKAKVLDSGDMILLILKASIVPLTPNGPENTQRDGPPKHFLGSCYLLIVQTIQ